METQDDFDEMAVLAYHTVSTNTSIIQMEMDDGSIGDDTDDDDQQDHRRLPRNRRNRFDTDRALQCIHTDFLCHEPVFTESEFKRFFRISRQRFQRLLEDVGNKTE